MRERAGRESSPLFFYTLGIPFHNRTKRPTLIDSKQVWLTPLP